MRSHSWWMVLATVALVTVPVAPGHAGSLHYGAKLGVNLANIRGDFADLADSKIQPGWVAGGFVSMSFVPVLGLELDALYVEKGFKIESQGTDQSGNPTGTVEAHLRLKYLDVPVLARVSLPSWGAVSPYLVVGPNIGFALSAKSEAFGETADLSSDLKKVDVGATGGIGFKWGAGPLSIGIESRYATGFSDLWDLEGNVESINQGVAITAWVAR
jgi:hypothetical protein